MIKNLKFEGTDVYMIENGKLSGGDNAKAVFSPERRELTVYIKDLNTGVLYLSMGLLFNEDYTSCKTCLYCDDVNGRRNLLMSYAQSIDSKVDVFEM